MDKRLKNLTPFTKDDNRAVEGGRKSKRGKSVKTILRMFLEKKIKGEIFTQGENVALALIEKARAGDVSAIKELYDRLEGKAVQKQEVSGPEGGPIENYKLTKNQYSEIREKMIKDDDC